MIQIYAPNNTNFEMNGDTVLVPSICENAAELGGSWSLNMTHPIDDEGRWKNIVEEAVISVPTFMGEEQLFRVVEMDKQDTEITVKAYPIFLDSKDEVFLMDKRPTAKTGQEALNILTEGTKYSGESDIAAGNTAYFVRRNLMDCLNGEYPSFATVWGGEPLYDNFKVIINERAGGDYGAEVRYGKNMEGISFKEDLYSVVTRIVPVAYNGRTLSTEYVDSPLIEKYAKIYTKAIKFEDVKWHEDLMESEDTEHLIVCYSQEELDAALIAKCNEQFESGIDLYSVTINVDLVSLENTEEYKDFKDLVRIGLGDDVSCYNNRLGITTKARAIKIVWDCIQNTAKEVVLGDYQTNFLAAWGSVLDKIASSMNQDGTLMAERIAGILNGINTQIKVQSTAAQKVESRVLLFEDLDPNSALYGALAIGTQGVQISRKRTADGRDWDWSTAITANGILADTIITGLLADKTGKSYWNLDTGEFQITDGKMYLKGLKTFRAEEYTEEDLVEARELFNATASPTMAQFEKYDLDGDGDISPLDFVRVSKLVNRTVQEYTVESFLEIDPANPTQILRTNNVYIGGGGIYSKVLNAQSIKGKQYSAIDFEGNVKIGASFEDRVSSGRKINILNGLIVGMDSDGYEVLWSGSMIMGNGSQIGLPALVSSQPNGIVLVFSRCQDGEAVDDHYTSHFVPNSLIASRAESGVAMDFLMSTYNFYYTGAKYLTIYDNKIVGSSVNVEKGTNSGITYDNSNYTLRYVLGV